MREPVSTHLRGLEQILAGAGPFEPAQSEASFCISGSDNFSVMPLPALMKRLGRLAPGMRLSFVDLVHPGNLEEMGRMEVDIVLPCTHEIPPRNVAEPMFWADWQVVAAAGDPRLERSGIGEGDSIPLDLYCDMDHIVFSCEGRHDSHEDQLLSALGRSRRIALNSP